MSTDTTAAASGDFEASLSMQYGGKIYTLSLRLCEPSPEDVQRNMDMLSFAMGHTFKSIYVAPHAQLSLPLASASEYFNGGCDFSLDCPICNPQQLDAEHY